MVTEKILIRAQSLLFQFFRDLNEEKQIWKKDMEQWKGCQVKK